MCGNPLMKNFPKAIRIPFLLLGVWCLLIASAWADPTISKVSLNTGKELVTVNAELVYAFNEKISEAIESGVAMTFTYEIELLKQSSGFGDDVVSKNKVTISVGQPMRDDARAASTPACPPPMTIQSYFFIIFIILILIG